MGGALSARYFLNDAIRIMKIIFEPPAFFTLVFWYHVQIKIHFGIFFCLPPYIGEIKKRTYSPQNKKNPLHPLKDVQSKNFIKRTPPKPPKKQT